MKTAQEINDEIDDHLDKKFQELKLICKNSDLNNKDELILSNFENTCYYGVEIEIEENSPISDIIQKINDTFLDSVNEITKVK
jgi:hypothetical protein